MPYPNYHSARVRDPGDFKAGSFRTKTLPKAEGGKGGVMIIIGRLKGKTTTTVQAYRFPKDKYTAAQAKAWLKDNDVKYISFEPAKEAQSQAEATLEVIPEVVQEASTEEIAALELEEGDWVPQDWKDYPPVPWNAKSFADVEMATSAKEATEQLHSLTYQFGELARNIFNDSTPDVTSADKLASLKSLAEEYLTRVAETMDAVESGEPLKSTGATPTWDQAPAIGKESATPVEAMEVEMTEMAMGRVLRLVEDDPGVSPPSGGIVPMALDVAFIEPGWGNERDNHYYPAEVLQRDAGVFAGTKMYETDHREHEKSTRTWVSTIKQIAGFTETGAPVARVIVHDEDFAKRIKALADAEMVERMECSILAAGIAKKGKIDGREANIIERITSARSVDWVTRGGAGGRALGIAESEAEMKGYQLTFKMKGQVAKDELRKHLDEALTKVGEGAEALEVELAEIDLPAEAAPEAKPQPKPQAEHESEPKPEPLPQAVTPEEISAALAKTHLPQPAKDKVAAGSYKDKAALEAAILSETEYVKALTGSGRPFALGASRGPNRPATMTEQEYEEQMAGILRRHGVSV